MPRFRVTGTVTTRDASATRVVCDGCDPARPCDEHADGPVLWPLTTGAFDGAWQRSTLQLAGSRAASRHVIEQRFR